MSRQQTMLQHVHAYLKYRQGLGFELQTSQILLPLFAKFVDRSRRRGPLTTDLILRWVHLPKNAALSYKAIRLSIVRGFARYMAARDGKTEVPDWRLLPKVSYRRPYLFSERQLQQLLTATGRLKPSYLLRPLTYRTLFGLLASTGLRISEALKLTRGHVDLKQGILRIEKTKFKKSRLVPLHPTATRALHRYAVARDRQWGQDGKKPFFGGARGQKLPYRTVLSVFHSLCAVIKINPMEWQTEITILINTI